MQIKCRIHQFYLLNYIKLPIICSFALVHNKHYKILGHFKLTDRKLCLTLGKRYEIELQSNRQLKHLIRIGLVENQLI